jgi:cleavage and polyadenylation specificity factor subunit 1
MRLAGKLICRGSINTASSGHPVPSKPSPTGGGRLFFASDSVSGKRFLVNTGSSFSILLHHSHAPARGPALKSVNGGRIRCWGFRQLSIAVSGQSFSWRFLLADVRFTILGIDFLKHHQLVVDVYSEQLLPRASLSAPVAGDVFAVADCAANQVPAAISAQQWTEILEQFPSVTKPFEVRSAPAHGVEHSIETVGQTHNGEI